MAASTLPVLFLMVFCVACLHARDLEVGSSLNNQLVYSESVKLSAIPFKTRTENVFFSDYRSKIIKGVRAVDHDQSEAKVTLTSGGVGFSFVNVKIKSEKGVGLNYQVQVFV